jgi:hypothetical protein
MTVLVPLIIVLGLTPATEAAYTGEGVSAITKAIKSDNGINREN